MESRVRLSTLSPSPGYLSRMTSLRITLVPPFLVGGGWDHRQKPTSPGCDFLDDHTLRSDPLGVHSLRLDILDVEPDTGLFGLPSRNPRVKGMVTQTFRLEVQFLLVRHRYSRLQNGVTQT